MAETAAAINPLLRDRRTGPAEVTIWSFIMTEPKYENSLVGLTDLSSRELSKTVITNPMSATMSESPIAKEARLNEHYGHREREEKGECGRNRRYLVPVVILATPPIASSDNV